MKTYRLLIVLMLISVQLLTSCNTELRVGELQNESRSVELGDASSVRVEIAFGAGDLHLSGGAESLLEADFTYNVAKLKPKVVYSNDSLSVRQPGNRGLPELRGITDFRNEWDLRLSDAVPMDLSVDVGSGVSSLHLAGLSLTQLDISLGAGRSTVDLGGEWQSDLDVTIDAGAADLSVVLPKDIGIRVEVDPGASIIEAPDLIKDGNIYTTAAYGMSDVTIQVKLSAGIGWVSLEVEEAAATQDNPSAGVKNDS